MSTSDTINNFNELVSQASDAILCNSDCQQMRKSEELKQKYVDARTNLASAPSQVYTAQKNYITFADGQSAYNEMRKEDLQQRAEKISTEFSIKFNDEENVINTQIDSYDGLLINFKNIFDLFRTYKNENKKLLFELKNKTSDVITNERKTLYEDQRIDGLKYFYYYIILSIYIICIICFVAFSFFYPSQSSFKTRVLVLIALVVLPFVSSWILGYIIYLIYAIYSLLPKNVYR